MSKQPRMISNAPKKKGMYSAPSHWRDWLKYQGKHKTKNIWAATVVLVTIVTFPTYAPMLIPDNTAANAIAFVDQTISRQQLYGDTIHYNREKIRIANIDAPEISQAKCDSELNEASRRKPHSRNYSTARSSRSLHPRPET